MRNERGKIKYTFLPLKDLFPNKIKTVAKNFNLKRY